MILLRILFHFVFYIKNINIQSKILLFFILYLFKHDFSFFLNFGFNFKQNVDNLMKASLVSYIKSGG